jgi:hypothetical protein
MPTLEEAMNGGSSSDRSKTDRAQFFLVGSLGIFGFGALYGVRAVLQREKVKLDMRGAAFNVAAKALLYGTALCFGTASLGTAIFITTSGIKTWPEFSEKTTAVLSKYDFLQIKDEKVKEDIKRINALTEAEQSKLWDDMFTIARESMREGDREKLNAEAEKDEEKREAASAAAADVAAAKKDKKK